MSQARTRIILGELRGSQKSLNDLLSRWSPWHLCRDNDWRGHHLLLMLLIGFYGRLEGPDIAAQDTVVREYLIYTYPGSLFGELVLTFIFITFLTAGMSTLDGILVSLSAMVVNDIAGPVLRLDADGLSLSRWVLVGV